MVNFTEKQNNLLIFMLSIFFIVMCTVWGFAYWTAWPKEFRGGVFNKLDAIGAKQYENAYELKELRKRMLKMERKQKMTMHVIGLYPEKYQKVSE